MISDLEITYSYLYSALTDWFPKEDPGDEVAGFPRTRFMLNSHNTIMPIMFIIYVVYF